MKNKKIKFNSCIVFTFLTLLALQTYAQKKVEVGFRYMPTITDFKMNASTGGEVSGEAVLGYGIGAFVGWNFSNHISVQGELIYNSLSQKYSEQGTEIMVNLKYINIPVLFSLNTNKMGAVNLSLVGGPQIGYNIGSRVNASGTDGTYNSQAELTIKKSDLGFAYGAGLDFALNEAKTFRLGFGYRGVIGLMDIGDGNQSSTENKYNVVDHTKVRTYSLYTGVSFLF